jgi:hypothetical protein
MQALLATRRAALNALSARLDAVAPVDRKHVTTSHPKQEE